MSVILNVCIFMPDACVHMVVLASCFRNKSIEPHGAEETIFFPLGYLFIKMYLEVILIQSKQECVESVCGVDV